MDKPTVLLTGASGNTGRVIAQDFLQRGIPFVAMSHGQGNLARLKDQGMSTVFGDFEAPDTLASALAGIKKAYLVSTQDEKSIARETAFVAAARKVGVEHLVACSAYLSGENADALQAEEETSIRKRRTRNAPACPASRPVRQAVPL
ncbi:NAD(P)H-binding protein [Cystobacter ferrugineus]|uniref:NAD(P)H-binding protein n=1 Tax=Cystobacter ferrugineus TaxID=83449 RepID=UPI000903AC4F|nr:NAD(P)H-binding protein [Cystobacter ferrugineus]